MSGNKITQRHMYLDDGVAFPICRFNGEGGWRASGPDDVTCIHCQQILTTLPKHWRVITGREQQREWLSGDRNNVSVTQNGRRVEVRMRTKSYLLENRKRLDAMAFHLQYDGDLRLQSNNASRPACLLIVQGPPARAALAMCALNNSNATQQQNNQEVSQWS